MSKIINTELELSELKIGDKIYKNSNVYSVSENDDELKEIKLSLLGEPIEVNLGIGEYKGTISPLRKTYKSIIESGVWEIR